jgi:hypothetical protein
MVVGTFAAVPYVHLQLEARRRYYPNIPLLVHDDGSHRRSQLSALCRDYDCDFEHNESRQPPCMGDLTAFLGGLIWADAHDVDVLVKVSRRWLFLTDWRPSLKSLALASQYATFSSYTTTFNFGFRTECVGLAVGVWNDGEFLNDAKDHICSGDYVFVEAYIHGFARRFERRNGDKAEQWRRSHAMPDDRNGYALWPLLGTDRCEPSPHFLWHDCCAPADYLAMAQQWRLPYSLEDFTDPNDGAGTGL